MTAQGGPARAVASILVVGLLLSAGLAGVASIFASSHPDGLEAVAQEHGFADTARQSATADSPVADYELGDDGGRFSVGAAGLIGVLITAAAAFALFALLKPRADSDQT